MTIQVNYRDALNGHANQKLGQDLARWNAIAKHVLVWDHTSLISRVIFSQHQILSPLAIP